jgi:hypothetical protein
VEERIRMKRRSRRQKEDGGGGGGWRITSAGNVTACIY